MLLISGFPMPASTSYDTAEDAKGKRENEKKKKKTMQDVHVFWVKFDQMVKLYSSLSNP